ncbi:hypothetical protein CQA49_07110 [Helicobacter sp. MIT 00-7814]|uniref:hypothetical protein n=1 Tax=unclassified Helicobacter TaxID=2593540 RepID=UPI000E1F90EE|nr:MULTISPECIES: hypothetical protein [unclassified Helicobacter]RDU52682.1 hypothetical protein CQA37_08090 [Helicobacter sp. MIT 99-10781]RDU53115.1 hypothetical protein CQA49_07110 [Helicobacter sp. MIT 00-7814]
MTKYLKIACILGILGLGCNVIADDMQKEIEALKKENELLELKKKNEQLKAGKEVKESSAESAAVDKSGFLGFCKGEHKNTGCFIGVELGYAPSVENYLNTKENTPGATPDTFNQSTYSLPINLALGWQWYYAQNAGFQFKGHVGYASYNSSNTENGVAINLNSSAVHFGLEASYLYDFIYNETHTFGANVGIGYEFGVFVGQGYNVDASNTNVSFDSYFASSFITSIGIHYFYKSHHQFGLAYRYKSGYTIGEGGSQTIDLQGSSGDVKYSTTPNSAIMLSYLYRF